MFKQIEIHCDRLSRATAPIDSAEEKPKTFGRKHIMDRRITGRRKTPEEGRPERESPARLPRHGTPAVQTRNQGLAQMPAEDWTARASGGHSAGVRSPENRSDGGRPTGVRSRESQPADSGPAAFHSPGTQSPGPHATGTRSLEARPARSRSAEAGSPGAPGASAQADLAQRAGARQAATRLGSNEHPRASPGREASPAARRSPESQSIHAGPGASYENPQRSSDLSVASDQSISELRALMNGITDQPSTENLRRINSAIAFHRFAMENHRHRFSKDHIKRSQLVQICRFGASGEIRLRQKQFDKLINIQVQIEREKAAHDVLEWYLDHLGRLHFAVSEEPSDYQRTYKEFQSELLVGGMTRSIILGFDDAYAVECASHRSRGSAQSDRRKTPDRRTERSPRRSREPGA